MILQGDALTRLRELPTGIAQCCISSPPYYGLRDYGTDQWEGGDPGCDHRRNKQPGAGSWAASQAITDERGKESYRTTCEKCGAKRVGGWTGGDPECDHSQAPTRTVGNAPSSKSTLTTNNGQGPRPGDKFHADQRREVATHCPCGAVRADGQVGLEATPDEYIARLVEVFAEVRRVLRDDGTLWLNLGDSYNNRAVSRPSSHQAGLGFDSDHLQTSWAEHAAQGRAHLSIRDGDLKEKDLLGIPWLVALALRADGWYLRSDIIWAKPNPMPESVTDRPTQAHEHIFLLTKNPRYYYDADAIREQAGDYNGASWDERRADWQEGVPIRHGRAGAAAINLAHGADSNFAAHPAGRNKRNVWEVATQPFPEAHFATFPIKLVEPCLKAGSSPQACGECGAPWEKVIEPTGAVNNRAREDVGDWIRDKGGNADGKRSLSGATYRRQRRATGDWQPTCDHDNDSGQSLVLDPFAGSGTVGVVCEMFGRDFLGVELNADYCALAERRILAEGRTGKRNQVPEQIEGQMSMDLST